MAVDMKNDYRMSDDEVLAQIPLFVRLTREGGGNKTDEA